MTSQHLLSSTSFLSVNRFAGIPPIFNSPRQWPPVRLDRLFDLRKSAPEDGDVRVTAYLNGLVTARSNVPGQKIKGVIHETGWQKIRKGDFAISGMNAHLGGMGVSDSDGKCSPIYLVLEPRKGTNANYISLAVRHGAHLGAIKALVQTIRFNSADLKRDDLKSIFVPLPPTDEQEQIVRFVRNLDSKVNRLIKAKKKLIELLNEQKQAIIHQAVTRGLDPSVPLKPSGIDWVGSIPTHWESLAIKRLLRRMDYGTSESSKDEGAIKVLTMGNIQDGEVTIPENGGLESVPDELLLEHHDLLFNRTNSPELVGKVGLFRGERKDNISFASYLVRLRPNFGICPEWLNFMLNCEKFWAFARSQALVSLHQANLNSTRYGQMKIPVPTRMEQEQIVNHLNSVLQPLFLLVQKQRTEINLIQEYRTRLVSDVVTGQLDVRNLDLPEIEDTMLEAIESADEEEDAAEGEEEE